MVLVLCKNKPLGDHGKCKDHLEREMLKEKGSRRAQIPADDKQWISVFLSRGPPEILHSTFTDFCFGLILHLKRLLFSPHVFLNFFSSSYTFFSPFLVYKRKVDLFQILHSPRVFAFCSMAQNRKLILQSTKYWIKFWRFVWLKCTRCPCWASWSVHWTSSQRICCHLEHCFPGEGEAEHCYGGHFLTLLTLFDEQSRYIWFYSQNMSVPFSWQNCCAEVILPRCLVLL